MSDKQSNGSVEDTLVTDQKQVNAKYADVAVEFLRDHDHLVPEIDPVLAKKLRTKLAVQVLGLTFLVNMLMYMDKATLGYSSISGFWEHTGLDQNKYNNVNTIFYVGFIVGQFPGTYLILKYRLSKLMFVITVFWSIIIFLHCAAYNYAGVIVLRFFLGFFESVSIPILTTTNGMFFSRHFREMTQPIFYVSCMASPIPIGFISYGVLHAKTTFGDYRVLNIIIGGLTLFLSVLVYFVYPDNPIDAKFFTTEEKVWIIRNVQGTSHISIEQKTFKAHHAKECFKDYVTWLIAGFFLLQQLANNLAYQQTLLFTNYGGITNLDSTLVSVAGAGFAVLWSVAACLFLWIFPSTTCLTIIWTTLPALVGSIVAVSLPWSNTIGELAAISMASQSFGVGWICVLGLAQTTAGASYTKRITRNAIMMFTYSIANIISPQLWQERDAPRYRPAWIVQIVLSFFTAPALIGVVWFILRRRNIQRRALIGSEKEVGIVKDDQGNKIVTNIAALDFTDLEDKTFIYPT